MHLLIWLHVVVTCNTFSFDVVEDMHTHVQLGEVPVLVALVGCFSYVLLL